MRKFTGKQGNFDIPSYLQIGGGSMPENGVTQHDDFMLILKIIGIVLCVIIGILAMILFVPVLL